MAQKVRVLACIILASSVLVGRVSAQSAFAVSRGWYDNNGLHLTPDVNGGEPTDSYGTGWDTFNEYRSFFVFDVPTLTEAASAVSLTLWNPNIGFTSDTPSLTFELWDVTTPVAQLEAFQTDAVGIFDDLGSGVSFGSISLTSADTGVYIVIDLNAAGLAAFNAVAVNALPGAQFALGGSVASLDYGTSSQFLFEGSLSTTNPPTTGPSAATLSVVPEPGTVTLLGLAAAGALIFRRRSFAR